MNKKWMLYGALAWLFTLQTGCMRSQVIEAPQPPAPRLIPTTIEKAVFANCHDILIYHISRPNPTLMTSRVETAHALPHKEALNACIKLNEAIKLSTPGEKKQDDKRAMTLLKELHQDGVLVGSDLLYSKLMYQHISQSQALRKSIDTLKKHLKKTEAQNTKLKNQLGTLQSQLDQLKNIEIEIEKKERSVISTTDE